MKLRYKLPFFNWLAQLFQKVSGIPPLTMQRAKAGGLTRLTAYGGLKLQAKGVPTGYTVVDWVSNNANTLVPTGVVIHDGEEFEIEVTYAAVTGSFYLFQARDITSGTIVGLSGSGTGNTIIAGSGYGVACTSAITRIAQNWYHTSAACTFDTLTVTVETNGSSDTNSTSFDPGLTGRPTTDMCLFGNKAIRTTGAINRLSAGCKVEFAKLKINGTYVLDLKPVTRDFDGTPGFINLVDGTFLTATEGSLNAGPVTEIVPTPDKPCEIWCNNGIIHAGPRNLTDYTDDSWHDGFFSTSGGITTAGEAWAQKYSETYIAVDPKSEYTVSVSYSSMPPSSAYSDGYILWVGLATYDADKTFLSRVIVSSTDNTVSSWTQARTFNSNVAFVRISLRTYNVLSYLCFCKTSELNWYADGPAETLRLSTKNLYDVNAVTEGKYIGANGVIGDDNNACYSDLIKVESGQQYTFSGICGNIGTESNYKRIHGYIDGVWNSQIIQRLVLKNQPYSITFTIPQNVNGIRISCWKDDTKRMVESGSFATNYVDYNNSTATTEMLLKLLNYTDTHTILHGIVTRKLGIHVFDGTESFNSTELALCYSWQSADILWGDFSYSQSPCTHYRIWSDSSLPPVNGRQGYAFRSGWNSVACISFGATAQYSSTALFKNFLSQQYRNGTPVIVVYPLATPTTESVTPQPMSVVDGDNTLEIVQASLTGLELAAEYKRH